MPHLDHASPLPLWAQIHADLRRRLLVGEFQHHVPSEEELVADYGVSRGTVRQALARLTEDGLVERRRGRGTFVVDPGHLDRSPGVGSLAITLRSLGVAESSVVRCREMRQAGAAAQSLGIARNEPVVYVERLRLGDGEPLALDRSWMPASIASELLEADLTSGSLYSALARHCGVTVTGGSEHIRPAAGSPQERALLLLPPDEALFIMERVAMDGTVAVEHRRTLLRGDRYELFATWGAQTR
ncbi:MAG: GntR family transcriptional regulator [Acidimicrobiales bacterium]